MFEHRLHIGLCALLLVGAFSMPSVAQPAQVQDQQDQTSEPCAQVYACVESQPMTDEEAQRSPAYHQSEPSSSESGRAFGAPSNPGQVSRNPIWSARKG